MSLLSTDSPKKFDAWVRGVLKTMATRRVVWITVAAALFITVTITLFVVFSDKPFAATGEIVQAWAHPMHLETSGFDANGAPMPKESFDHVLVFTHVKLHNQNKFPLFLTQIATNATLQDGVHTSFAANVNDYGRIFIAYPELSVLCGTPLPSEATLAPGETVEGDFVSSFRVTKKEWDTRKDLNYVFHFRMQPSLTLAPRSAVTEQ